MRTLAAALVLFILVPAIASHHDQVTFASQAVDTPRPCGPSGTAHVRTTLYFGLTRPTGTVSEQEWRIFVRDHVTPRFPDGLTLWGAEGQWRRPDGRIARERSKVLLLVHDDTASARATLGELVTIYKRMFEQESVLWESSLVCASF
jgi:hypothetical protein